jgi:hypothetical protein
MEITQKYPYTKIMLRAVLTVCLLTAAFFYIYWNYPFPGDWNDILLNFSFTFVATMAAPIATHISRRFKRGDPPRRVWVNLAIGLWCWVVAEAVWAILALFMEVPDVSWADIPWVGAYYFLVAAFVYQFRLIARPTKAQERKWLSIALSVTLLGSVLVTQLARALWNTEQTWFDTYLSIFYVFADLTLAMAALKIARTFGRGMLGRAWVGLLVFAISDIFYSALLTSGLYAQSAKSDSVLSMFADGLYFDAYLVTALALLSNYVLFRYGPKPIPASEFRLDAS